MIPCLVAFFSGCGSLSSGWTHGATFAEYKGRVLNATHGSGYKRLRIEENYDVTVRGFVEDHGTPEFIFVESRYVLYLIYVEDDVLATFERGATSQSKVTIITGIPDDLRVRLAAGSPSSGGSTGVPDQRPIGEAVQGAPEAVSYGTCFSVHPDGLILTSNHVVGSANQVAVKFPAEELRPAQVMRRDVNNDLALLKTEKGRSDYLALAPSRSSQMGDEVFTIGYPAPELLGVDPKFSEGVVSAA